MNDVTSTDVNRPSAEKESGVAFTTPITYGRDQSRVWRRNAIGGSTAPTGLF